MRRLSLTLVAAALAAAGVTAPAHASPLTVCVKSICVCHSDTECSDIDPPANLGCIRIDLDDDNDFEELCLPSPK